MTNPSFILSLALAMIVLKWSAEMFLEWMNRHHTQANRGAIPDPLKDAIGEQTYAKSIEYTLAKSRLNQFELTYDALILTGLLWIGLIPFLYYWIEQFVGTSAWAQSLILILIAVAFSLFSTPFDWHAQFRLEERFGFNTTTQSLWWTDRAKGLILVFVFGYPLVGLILKFVDWTGAAWWIWGWAALLSYQVLMIVLAPIVILPLFNKFTPLAEGSLRDRLLALSDKTGFRTKQIQVMDGSKRSKHSNAFFTGFGKFRRIVLFDTLIAQLAESELEAVLAHEIGHSKLKHIPKTLAFSAASSFIAFFIASWLATKIWFYDAFGFQSGSVAPALLLFVLLNGVITFWLSPITNLLSRRYEYQADAYAAKAVRDCSPLIGALRKLNEKNLSNLTPHPCYSRFYYSHPTLLERESALRAPDRRKESQSQKAVL